jgi:hypothetical protein
MLMGSGDSVILSRFFLAFSLNALASSTTPRYIDNVYKTTIGAKSLEQDRIDVLSQQIPTASASEIATCVVKAVARDDKDFSAGTFELFAKSGNIPLTSRQALHSARVVRSMSFYNVDKNECTVKVSDIQHTLTTKLRMHPILISTIVGILEHVAVKPESTLTYREFRHCASHGLIPLITEESPIDDRIHRIHTASKIVAAITRVFRTVDEDESNAVSMPELKHWLSSRGIPHANTHLFDKMFENENLVELSQFSALLIQGMLPEILPLEIEQQEKIRWIIQQRSSDLKEQSAVHRDWLGSSLQRSQQVSHLTERFTAQGWSVDAAGQALQMIVPKFPTQPATFLSTILAVQRGVLPAASRSRNWPVPQLITDAATIFGDSIGSLEDIIASLTSKFGMEADHARVLIHSATAPTSQPSKLSVQAAEIESPQTSEYTHAIYHGISLGIIPVAQSEAALLSNIVREYLVYQPAGPHAGLQWQSVTTVLGDFNCVEAFDDQLIAEVMKESSQMAGIDVDDPDINLFGFRAAKALGILPDLHFTDIGLVRNGSSASAHASSSAFTVQCSDMAETIIRFRDLYRAIAEDHISTASVPMAKKSERIVPAELTLAQLSSYIRHTLDSTIPEVYIDSSNTSASSDPLIAEAVTAAVNQIRSLATDGISLPKFCAFVAMGLIPIRLARPSIAVEFVEDFGSLYDRFERAQDLISILTKYQRLVLHPLSRLQIYFLILGFFFYMSVCA